MFLYIMKFSFHGETRSEFDYDWSVISPWDIVTLMARELARKYLFCFACTPGRGGGEGEGDFRVWSRVSPTVNTILRETRDYFVLSVSSLLSCGIFR